MTSASVRAAMLEWCANPTRHAVFPASRSWMSARSILARAVQGAKARVVCAPSASGAAR